MVIMMFSIIRRRSIHSCLVGLLCLVISSAICCLTAESSGRCIDREKRALLRFKQGLVDESNVLVSWESKRDCCKWRGIACSNQTGHVITLDLYYNSSDIYNAETPLRGEIDPSLGDLRYLSYLDLSFNRFEGKILEFVGSLSELKVLKLGGNNFHGPIPPQLGNLSNLHTLDLAQNFIITVGNLDWSSHLSSLRYLNMSSLNFSGVVTWPQSISKLPSLIELQLSSCNLPDVDMKSSPFLNSSTSLEVLELSDNFVAPSIFYWMSNISTNLVYIGLLGNGLEGTIPDVFTNMVSLKSLDLSYNKLEGGIPESFRNLCSLESLSLLSNNFSDRLQNSIENLSCAQDSLGFLSLTDNKFWGSFPDDITRFSSLTELYIEGTHMDGSLPKSFQQLSQLRSLSLVFNKLSGPLPDFTGLSSLRQLFLSSNELSGSLPVSIGQLSSLEDLSLANNALQGVITEVHFSNLSHLQSLDVSYNTLTLDLSQNWNPPFQLRSLVLSSCKVGPAFPKWIQTQRKLTTLYMPNAGISDSIPDKFWDLSSQLLELNLSMNQIHGKLPNLSANNYSFFVVDLSSNHLSGPVPPFSPNIGSVYLSKNKFSGLLSSFCPSQASGLFNLDLSENSLSGELPSCWMQYQGLLALNLAKNKFSGRIPTSLGYLSKIGSLRIQNNNLSGELPSLENCTELRLLDLSANRLSGQLPSWIGLKLGGLLILDLKSNQFHGSIPSSLCNLALIHVLDLSHNNISGALPDCLNNLTGLSSTSSSGTNYILGNVKLIWKGIDIEFGENLKHLRSIDISSNYLSGAIPENITSLVQLISLNLSRNNLTGSLSDNFGHLKMLESLDLSRNHLSGTIPASFSGLNFLGVLDLSYNNLSGKIPESTQLQSFNAAAYTGNLGLCGPPLTPRCQGDGTTQDPAVSNGDESDQTEGDDGFRNLGFFVSMLLGFIIGFWGVCGTLVLKRSCRHAYFKFMDDRNDWICVTVAVYKAKLQRRLER